MWRFVQDSGMFVEVALESAHGLQLHASVAFDDISADWQQYRATLTANATDTTARLAVRLQVALPSWLPVQPCTFSAAQGLLKLFEACDLPLSAPCHLMCAVARQRMGSEQSLRAQHCWCSKELCCWAWCRCSRQRMAWRAASAPSALTSCPC